MKRGTNIFSVLVSDVSGTSVTGLSGADFTLNGEVGPEIYDTGDIKDVSPTVEDGIYLIEVDITNRGQGFLSFKPTNSDYFITPDYFTLDVKDRDVDDVYNRITLNFLEISSQIGDTFVTTNLTLKEGDDVIVQIPTNRILTGFDQYKSSLVFSDTLDPSGANYIGDLEIESVDEIEGIVTVKFPFDLTDGIVPVGSNRLRVFGDLQARDGDDRITLASFRVSIIRQFTTG